MRGEGNPKCGPAQLRKGGEGEAQKIIGIARKNT
jgi:hypothetical protein